MITLTSPSYATTETQVFQAWHKQKQRRVRKSHNPSFIVSYPYVTNYMPSPFDPEGWYGATTDADGTITNVALENPSGQSFMGLAEQAGAGQFSLLDTIIGGPKFDAVTGESIYFSVIVKEITQSPAISLFFTVGSDTGNVFTSKVRVLDGSVDSGTGLVNSTDLGYGFILIQVKHTLTEDRTNIGGRMLLLESDGTGVVPPIGSQLYVQAAFFGKADDYPANVMPTL